MKIIYSPGYYSRFICSSFNQTRFTPCCRPDEYQFSKLDCRKAALAIVSIMKVNDNAYLCPWCIHKLGVFMPFSNDNKDNPPATLVIYADQYSQIDTKIKKVLSLFRTKNQKREVK